jgi:hypothetical protein
MKISEQERLTRAQAWCEEHAEHKSVPGTKFVSGRLLCSRDDVVKLLQPLERLRSAYLDLIMQVANKWPGENRHDTAKRYIVEREAQSAQGSEQRSLDLANEAIRKLVDSRDHYRVVAGKYADLAQRQTNELNALRAQLDRVRNAVA